MISFKVAAGSAEAIVKPATTMPSAKEGLSFIKEDGRKISVKATCRCGCRRPKLAFDRTSLTKTGVKARVIMVLLFLCCLAAGWEAYRLRLQINQLAATLERHKADESSLEVSQKIETDLKDRLAALDQAARPPQVQAPKTDKAKSMDPEATKRAIIAFGRHWLEQPSAPLYAHLARSLGLSDIQLDRLRDLNAERQYAAMNAFTQAQTKASQDGSNLEDAKAQAIQAMVPVESRMKELLGDAGFAEYLQQVQLAPAEAAIQQMSQSSAGTAQPLTDSQQLQLTQLLTDELTKSGGFFASLQLIIANQNVTVSDATVAQAASFLSPDQMQMLNQYRGIAEAKAAVLRGVQVQFNAIAKAAAASADPASSP